jgi:uncharacterized protein (DUF4415 family)
MSNFTDKVGRCSPITPVHPNKKNKYNFSKAIKNPYAKKLKKPISIHIDEDVIDSFKKIADDVGISYQVLMNLYNEMN